MKQLEKHSSMNHVGSQGSSTPHGDCHYYVIKKLNVGAPVVAYNSIARSWETGIRSNTHTTIRGIVCRQYIGYIPRY